MLRTIFLILAAAFLLCHTQCQPVHATPISLNDFTGAIGQPPKFATFKFPKDVVVAEILYAAKPRIVEGKTAMTWGRVLAKGDVRLPTNCWLQIMLRYDGLERLETLKQLSVCNIACLSAEDLDFEDKHMQYIKDFKDLQILILRDTLVTDGCLPIASTFAKLKRLDLTKASINGDHLEYINKLSNLTNLSLEGTNLKPGNVAKIKPIMPQLQMMRLSRINLTKADAVYLQYFTKAYELDLGNNSQLDNGCIKYLAGLKNLKHLEINDSAINDKVVPALIKLPSLRLVRVRDKTFWTTKDHESRHGKVSFVDVADFADAQPELFRPLH